METEIEMTEEASDALLRDQIFADDSGINESEEQVNEIDSHIEEVDSSENTEEEEQEETPEPPKKKSNVAKILAEKNEYKRQALEAKAMVEELRWKLGQDSETDVSFFESKMKQMLAENNEKQWFFAKNPWAYEIKEDLDLMIEENPNLSYDRAYKFYLAETNPQALLDEQTQNKLNSKVYSSSWRAPANARTTTVQYDYSDAELDKLIKAGKIKL